MSNVNRLANEYISKGEIITAFKVNKILSFASIKITQYRLDKILTGPRLNMTNLSSNTTKSSYFIGTVRGNIQIPGVYI